ncbi:MAG: DUF4381 domain-containing protein [Lactobacillales bacterium]|nr:DUF4381 domain-containing protein [Lactobacillales bacterium]
MDREIDLDGLRGLQVLKAPAILPPAWGWWVAGAMLLVSAFVLIYLYRRFYRDPKFYALRELKRIKIQASEGADFAKEVSKLLKRIALYLYDEKKIAALSQDKWRVFLQKAAPGIYTQKQAQAIAYATYLPKEKLEKIQTETLYLKTTLWIKHVFKGK